MRCSENRMDFAISCLLFFHDKTMASNTADCCLYTINYCLDDGLSVVFFSLSKIAS